MVTGYTAKLHDGKEEQTFEDYMLSCARAFGALILMRDDPADAPIPEEFKPSDHHACELKTAEGDLARVSAMTDEETERAAAAAYERALISHHESQNRYAGIRQRYEAMLAKVDAWVPPTEQHANFKQFMRSQLLESIQWDCTESAPPTKITGDRWREDRLKSIDWSIRYHTRENENEIARTNERNAWVKALRDSLKNSSD